MEDIKENKIKFNCDGDPRYYKEDEIDYVINMFETNYKDIRKAKLIEPFHGKASDTLVAIMTDLNLPT
jgi:hypothetical protein